MPTILDEIRALSPEAQNAIAQTERAAQLMRNLLADPEIAKQVTPLVDKAAKKANPLHQTTEEIAQPIVDRIMKSVDEKIAALKESDETKTATQQLQAQIDAAKQNDSITDEGITNILTAMKEKGVGDFETAKKAYLHDRPPVDSTPGNSSQMDWNVYETMQSGDMKSFFDGSGTLSPGITDNPEKWERAAALKYLNNEIALPN